MTETDTAVEGASRTPALFIWHGGGPCFSMDMDDRFGPNSFKALGEYLRGIDAGLGFRPKAVLVISGHWEEAEPTVNAGAHPPMLFDYYGFPEHTYRLSYPAPGSPELAAEVRELLAKAGFPSQSDDRRGFDHGVFVPFMLVYPDADVPIVQLSLQHSLDPALHIAMGRALAPLRDQGVLIVGSGMTYHNLRYMAAPQANAASEAFNDWLDQAATDPDPASRDHKLARWMTAPDALHCHPRPEHLLPLMVVAGAAGPDTGRRVYNDHIAGKAISGFEFG